ncbi:hypothetical protein P12x_003171 [Tundrisphaera lichenicola]|uniref:hypothetical protein n=1 Tax=Tundrisphaera lichenicola TaxID=2029860 RepID=UPI003EC02B4A
MSASAVRAAFELFRRVFPLRVADPSEPGLTQEERDSYRRWELGSLLPLFLLVPATGYGWYLALSETARFLHPEAPDTQYLLRPIPILWCFPAFFLGIITSAIPLTVLYRALLGERYRRYVRACDERVGFDGYRAFSWMAIVIVVGSVLFTFLMARTYTRFTKDGIEIARTLSLQGALYEYNRVRSIERRSTFRAPNGNTIHLPHFVLNFDDGGSWSTREGFRDPEPELDGQIARWISRRSGRAIIEVP